MKSGPNENAKATSDRVSRLKFVFDMMIVSSPGSFRINWNQMRRQWVRPQHPVRSPPREVVPRSKWHKSFGSHLWRVARRGDTAALLELNHRVAHGSSRFLWLHQRKRLVLVAPLA